MENRTKRPNTGALCEKSEQSTNLIDRIDLHRFACTVEIADAKETTLTGGRRDLRQTIRVTDRSTIETKLLTNGLVDDALTDSEISLRFPQNFTARVEEHEDHLTVWLNARGASEVVELAEAMLATGAALLKTAKTASDSQNGNGSAEPERDGADHG